MAPRASLRRPEVVIFGADWILLPNSCFTLRKTAIFPTIPSLAGELSNSIRPKRKLMRNRVRVILLALLGREVEQVHDQGYMTWRRK
jgi:hypothetical protein